MADLLGVVTLPLQAVLSCLVMVFVLLVMLGRTKEGSQHTAAWSLTGYPQWTEWREDKDGDFVRAFTRIAMKRLDNTHLCSILVVSVRAWNRGVGGIVFMNKHGYACQVVNFIKPGRVGTTPVEEVVDYVSSPNLELAKAFLEHRVVEEVALERNVYDDLKLTL